MIGISVSNQKGGTGKTTISVNTAGALKHLRKDVLLIDLDPQGYATEATGLSKSYEKDSISLHDILLDVDRQEDIEDIIREANEFDVIPSNTKMVANNTETQLKNATGGEQRLKRAFEYIPDKYDFVIIDCPPGLGSLTDNALLATRRILIPAEAKGTSIRALELLKDQIDSLEMFFDTEIKPIGLVANEVRPDGVSDQMIEWFDEVFGDNVPIFQIRKRVKLQRAMQSGKSIIEHREKCDMEDVFINIAKHIINQKKVIEA